MKKQLSIDRYFILLLTLMTLLLFWPLYNGTLTLKWDAMDLTLPSFSLIRYAVLQGEFPLWNPFQDQGWATGIVPLFWNPIYLILGTLFASPHHALNSVYLILIMISGWGFYKFSGLFFHHPSSAMVAGLVYPFSGFFLAHSQHLGGIEGAAWSPVILYLSHQYLKHHQTRHLLFLAISFYLFSTGAYPGFVIVMIYLLFFQALYHVFQNQNNLRNSLRKILHIVAATGFVSWLTWKLYLQQLRYITRGSGDWKISTDTGSSLFSDLWSLIFSKTGTTALDSFWLNDPAFLNSFFSLLLLIWAGYGLVRRPGRRDIQLAFASLFFLLISMASSLPFREWLNLLPGFSYFRMAALFRVFFIALMIILGIRGMEKGRVLQENQKLALILISTGIILFLLRNFYFSKFEIPEMDSVAWNQYLNIDLWKIIFFLGIAALILLFNIRPTYTLLCLLIIAEVATGNYLNQKFLLYNSIPTKNFAEKIARPEKKSFDFHPDQSIGKYKDSDFQIGSVHRNTGTYFHQIVRDGYWPYESRFHHILEKSDRYDQQLRFPLIYLSKDTGDFLLPDFLNFDDQITLQSSSLNRYEINVLTHAPATMIFNQNYHKNWRAYLDGKITPLHRTNHSMIKTHIPKGTHRLTFEYTSGGINHLFWTTMILLGGCTIFLIRRKKFPAHFLLFGFPVFFIGLLSIFEKNDVSEADLTSGSSGQAEWDYTMNYESKKEFWYFRSEQITISDSYDGYRAEKMTQDYIYSATLNIPQEALTGKKTIRYRFRIKSDDKVSPAVVLHSHTSSDDFYNIRYRKSFLKGEWAVLEGELDLPDTSDPVIRADFYIWNHKKDTFVIDDIQVNLIP